MLVERDFYSKFLFNGEWLSNFDGTQRKFVVLGQPGIGKSSFGIWLLAQLLRSNRTVVYSRNSTKARFTPVMMHYVFHRGMAFTTSPTSDLGAANALLAQPSVVHISDSLPPRLGDLCHKVLITSPDPDVWLWFAEKEYAQTAFFPLYNNHELEALREAEFGSALPPSTLAMRVRGWGPSTRAAFSPFQSQVKDSIRRSMNDKSLEELQRYWNQAAMPIGAAGNDTPHTLFMVDADRETLRESSVAFRSEAVARRVGRLVASRSRDAIIPALQRLLASRVTTSVAGTAFELAAIDVLAHCGEYAMRPLGKDGRAADKGLAGSARAPAASTVQRFGSLAELSHMCGVGEWDPRAQFFRPASPNLAAIDLIGPGLLLFQITVNRSSHALKVTSGRSDEEGLLALYRALLPLLGERWAAPRPHLDVCFVVPEGLGKGWGAQKLVLHQPTAAGSGGPGGQRAAGAPEPAVEIVEIEGGGTGFSVGGKVVEVRQHIIELPVTVFDEWLALPEPPRDAIDEAAET